MRGGAREPRKYTSTFFLLTKNSRQECPYVGSFYRNSTALRYRNEQYYEDNNLWSGLLLSQFSRNTNYEQLNFLSTVPICEYWVLVNWTNLNDISLVAEYRTAINVDLKGVNFSLFF